MLDVNKYIQIKDQTIIVGQNAAGNWYCKELPCESINQLKYMIQEVNKILNEANHKVVVVNKKKKPKPETPTKGLA